MDMFAVTLDTDWAPDFAIDFAAGILLKTGVKATWFITHSSPAIRRLYQNSKLFEFGIHPNFLPQSTHGKSEKEVMDHVMRLVPGTKIMRSHTGFQSSRLFDMIVNDYGIEIDVSSLLFGVANLVPYTMRYRHGGKALLRIPFFLKMM